MNLAALLALGIAFGYAVLKKGGVEQEDWNLGVLVVGVTGCLHFLWRIREKTPSLEPIAALSATAVLGFVAFQLVPLPLAVVRLISPKRLDAVAATLSVTGYSPRFVALSAVPDITASYLVTLGAYLTVFLVVRDLTLRFGERPWKAAWPLLVVGGLEAGLGLFQAYGQGVITMANGTYVNRDHFAGLLEMMLPLAALYALAVYQRDRNRLEAQPAGPALKASILLGLAVVILVGIVFSLSRMGYLAALAGLLTAAVALSPLNITSRKSPPWRTRIATAFFLFSIILGFVLLPTQALLARFADFSSEDISADTRGQLWRDTTGLIRDYPLFGCGMGAYESCFQPYKTVAPMLSADRAHNDYLQVLAELGAFGFLAGLVFVLRIWQSTLYGTRYPRCSDERYLAIGCLAAMTAMLIHSLADFNMYIPANGMAFAWIAGIAGAHLGSSQSRKRAQPPH